ncbi:MAG: hypothetical protein COT89_00045 [Candidatus Colwellbacteria bacterium CG10_big_fil_rev_8_21_14_0_10_42_22]|uniref:Peptidase n=1 Tax=Candidatus Colwellbacteria bacterium CG10_big_fil_rev_8_21_14_0_10_42_22 TaxID=1974540 RepID=A0A2H0VIY3_9BACT|nr:MAG: hypothetical protein COT89_00045 [Candidatus Colwellbacteria bacterium CG10_big_fil_rev_8_21_14_0_10_42_22]
MVLYLSSNGFPTRTQFKQLVGKKYNEAKVGFIMNAVDWRKPAERRVRYAKTAKRFKGFGIKPELLDLRKFYDREPKSLLKKLQQYDLLWVRGGNTFFLRYVMNRSGFDRVIKEALKGGLVYAGESAGSLVMGPTIKYIDSADDPSVVPKVIWRGIGLVDTVPLPHWGTRRYGSVLEETFRALKRDGVKVARFVDGEAMLVTDKGWRRVKANRYWR